MTIEELQKAWHSVKSEPRSHDELRAMMYSTKSPRMRRLQRKEILHFFISLSVLAAISLAFKFYEDWSTGIMIPLGVVEILDEYLGLRYVRWLPQKGTIEKTLLSHLKKLKLALLLSRLVQLYIYDLGDVYPDAMDVGDDGLFTSQLDLFDLAHQMKLRCEIEPAGILHVAAVDHVDERRHAPLAFAKQGDRAHRLAIDAGRLLARAQVRDGVGAFLPRHPIGDAAARAAEIEAEHQPGPFRRSPMHVREHAQRAMRADQPRRDALDKIEARPPDQRAIAEHPKVVGAVCDRLVHGGCGRWQPGQVFRSPNRAMARAQSAGYRRDTLVP